MPQILFTEYRDKYKQTPYPFSDTSDLIDTDGVALAKDLFLDASFYIPGFSSNLYLKSISRSANDSLLFTIVDDETDKQAIGLCRDTSDNINIVSCDYADNMTLTQVTDSISAINTNNRNHGIIVGAPGIYRKLRAGKLPRIFNKENTSFSVRCIIPIQNQGVTAISADNNYELGPDVWLIGTRGVVLHPITEPDAEETVIQIDVVGDPLAATAVYSAEQLEHNRVITDIAGAIPDEYGNIQITAGRDSSALRIKTTEDGIIISLAGAL